MADTKFINSSLAKIIACRPRSLLSLIPLFSLDGLVCQRKRWFLVATCTLLLQTGATCLACGFFHQVNRPLISGRKFGRLKTAPFSSSSTSSSKRNNNSKTSSSMNMEKRDSPSAQRNKQPIWQVLHEKVLPGLLATENSDLLCILEIAAGCGVHSRYFSLEMATANVAFQWYPSDPESTSRLSIEAYRKDEPSLEGKLQPALDLTLEKDGIAGESPLPSELTTIDLVICINMIHISNWSASQGLMKLAGERLRKGGVLFLYGPYKVNGQAVESNLRFDESLRSRDPSWGVRNLEDVLAIAKENGLGHRETIEMPANNLSVILEKI